ncbi:zinc finger HIT domain-containing protein 3-like isoform X3 [Asparagus officinalis]|uniref:zinc finger HIT domain-containing protein 3-like isoform X3 n=1 Tax=Asparagus officinalis TaxID=4686 RepID=UPI00098E02A2|nr:zinc finger HIT domain-containing protein 3-like isoform X3 [Asparagus officinalis]
MLRATELSLSLSLSTKTLGFLLNFSLIPISSRFEVLSNWLIMGSKNCEVCKGAQSKYKCPTCFIPYCSMVCFKKHKDIPCEKPVPPSEEPPKHSDTLKDITDERLQEIDDPSCVLSKEQLESIVKSSEIRSFLADVNLQEMIQKVDSSQDPENELDKAMGDQTILQFTDKVRSVINPEE